MATSRETEDARRNVASGNGSARDNRLVEQGAKLAGSYGSSMRSALSAGAKESQRQKPLI